MIKRLTYLLLLFMLGMHHTASALVTLDDVHQIDSILKVSITRVYENPDESIKLGMSVFENESYSKKSRTKALMLVSLAHTSKRNYQKALEYILKADEFSATLNDKVLQTEIVFRTGILYQQLKIFDKSIEYLERTERMALLYPVRDSVGKYLANSYIVKGFIYKDNLNCDIALEFFDKGIKEYLKLKNVEVNTNLSIVFYNKGNCYTLLSQYENAKTSFNRSIEHAQIEKANSLIAFAQKGLASVYTEQGEYQQAIDLLNTALDKSGNVGDLILNSSIYNGLFENHLALNQWDEYQKYFDLYAETQLKIKTSERNSVSHSLDENSKRQNEKLENQKKNFYTKLKWFFVALVLMISTVILIERRNKKVIKSLQSEIDFIQKEEPTS
ncbi:tetratricopeptide repeat protein [Psychroserpens sp. SPM9]|uniref:tetratricopeptide repeat protein n=1 Tax=Psychroserpens sp. SPM9 TaxID=2975598 RepID=UPI0021A371A4|nr:tetratricopeptide repeat protein [Psychroserpens sp. SPM9]MDG5491180.1 tetratricopeptide repeat protein [Psychroserpens sp. SPM9]